MLRKHAHALAKLTADKTLKSLVLDYFSVPRASRRSALTPILYQRGLGQADLVLALLRIHHARSRYYVGLLIGHDIVVCPPCLLAYRLYNTSRPTIVRDREDRRIVFVRDTNPRQPGTEAHLRWPWFEVGRTVAALRIRGVRRRDIRKAVDMGWIRLENVSTQANVHEKGARA